MHDFYSKKLLAIGADLKLELEEIAAHWERTSAQEPDDKFDHAFQRMGYNLAEELVECALAFSSAPIIVAVSDTGSGHATPRDFLAMLSSSPRAQMGISIALSNAALARVPEAVKRTESLLALVLARPLSPRAASYASRATNLYMWGHDVECVVLCRSALEAALSDCLADRVPDRVYSLNELVALALESRLLPPTLARSARALQRAGNAAVHRAPSLSDKDVPSALMAMKHLSAILSHIFPVPPADTARTA